MGTWRVNNGVFLRALRHDKPLMDGSLSAPTVAVVEYFSHQPDVRALVNCQERGDCAELRDETWRRLRRLQGLRYVIDDKNAPPSPLTAAVRRSAALKRWASSATLDIYEIREPSANGSRPPPAPAGNATKRF